MPMTPEQFLARLDEDIREVRRMREALRRAVRESDRLAREA